MAKSKFSITIEDKVAESVTKLSEKENRNFSNMIETLLDEALLQRIIRESKLKKK
jgi:hypothetical protein